MGFNGGLGDFGGMEQIQAARDEAAVRSMADPHRLEPLVQAALEEAHREHHERAVRVRVWRWLSAKIHCADPVTGPTIR